MRDALLIFQIIISIVLIVIILMQKRGAGLGGAFGGAGGGGHYEKRGAEKVLFNATVFFSILFVGLGFVILLVA
ncbi:MAG: preprotein translocase subunit SecG [Candidatus Spechtbacterales bacterium]